MTLPLSPDANLLLVGKGEVLYARYASGVREEHFHHFGNVQSLEITTNDDTLEKFSSMSKGSPLYKRALRRRNVQFRMVLDEFGVENMGMMLMGLVGETTQLATAVTDEVMATSVLLGSYYQMAKLGPYTGVTFEQDGSPDIALVEGTDFRWVNTNIGLIQILPDAVNIQDVDTLLASYTPTAYTAGSGVKTIAGGTESVIELALKFVADPSTGPSYHVDVWKVSINPDGAIGLISEEFASATLVGAVLSDSANHPDAPLFKSTQFGLNSD